MIAKATLDKLKNFIGGYFHEDMHIEADSWEGVLQKAMSDRPPQELRELSTGLEQYAADHPDDSELDRLMLHELGSVLRTEVYGLTARQWLYRVAELVRQEAEHRSMAQA